MVNCPNYALDVHLYQARAMLSHSLITHPFITHPLITHPLITHPLMTYQAWSPPLEGTSYQAYACEDGQRVREMEDAGVPVGTPYPNPY